MLFLNNILEPGGYHLGVEGDAVLGDVLSWRNECDTVVFNNPQVLLQHQHLDDLQVPNKPHLNLSSALQLVALHLQLNAVGQLVHAHLPPLQTCLLMFGHVIFVRLLLSLISMILKAVTNSLGIVNTCYKFS